MWSTRSGFSRIQLFFLWKVVRQNDTDVTSLCMNLKKEGDILMSIIWNNSEPSLEYSAYLFVNILCYHGARPECMSDTSLDKASGISLGSGSRQSRDLHMRGKKLAINPTHHKKNKKERGAPPPPQKKTSLCLRIVLF